MTVEGPDPVQGTGLRIGLQLKVVVAFAVLMFAIYAIIPYLLLRSEESHMAEMLATASDPAIKQSLGRFADRGRQAVLIASLINAILLLVAVMFLRSAIRPLRQITLGLRRLARGESPEPVHISSGDEIGVLAESYNTLTRELVRSRAELAVREQELERRVAERTRELELQKLFVEGIVEAADIGILTVDLDLKITSWNSYLERTLSRSKEAAMGQEFGKYFPMQERTQLEKTLREVIQSGELRIKRDFECSITSGDEHGTFTVMDISVIALRDTDGTAIGALMTLGDVTQRKELHMQLSHSTKLAAVSELAGGVAHEINNPLAIILGNAELLIDDLGEDSPLGGQASTIKRHALRCKGIVANLLKFAGRTTQGTGPVDLHKLLDETLTLLRKQLELDNISVEEKHTGSMGTILGSSDELQQVFFSLISNAKDAMPKGGTLTIESVRAGGFMEVKVTDTGHGIPKENLERVFSPFFTTKDPGKGTGLGLAIAHTIANKHGGRLSLESEVDQGTTVILRLPVTDAVADAPARTPRRSSAPPNKSGKMQVLLVDDENGIRMVCRETLERMHHVVTECRDGNEALEQLKGGKFDLILLDLKMPKMDGAETLIELRKTDETTPVLIMTGLIDEEMLATVPEGSFAGILKKPFQMSELRGWIGKLVQGQA